MRRVSRQDHAPYSRAIIAVDYAGQPCDYDALGLRAARLGIVADACHSLGGSYKSARWALWRISMFSVSIL